MDRHRNDGHVTRDRDDGRRCRHGSGAQHHKRGAEDDLRRRRGGVGGGVEEDHRLGWRHRSRSPSESPPAAKRERSSNRAPRDSVKRHDSGDREPPLRKRKDRRSGGGCRDGDEPDRQGGKRARASLDPSPRQEKRPRRESRRFQDVDGNGGQKRGKGDKGSLCHEQKKVEAAGANGDSRRGAAPNVCAQQPLNSAPAVAVPSSDPVPSKVSSITSTNENGGVSIRSDDVTAISSTDGTANSAAGRSSNLSLDALVKAKKSLQLKKELSEKLKRLPVLNNKLGTSIAGAQIPKKETHPVSGSSASAVPAGAASKLPASTSSVSGMAAAGISVLTNISNLDAVKRAQEVASKMEFRQYPHSAPPINIFPGASSELTVSQTLDKAPVLRLDAQGREIDEHGNVISRTKPSNLSTLKVNINKQKDAFQIIKPDFESLVKSTLHFDERIGINPTKLLRPKRPGFLFIEEGKLTRQAELQGIKNQFGEARAREHRVKQAQLADANMEVDMNPNLIEIAPGKGPPKQKQKEEIPDTEPWDSKILTSATYEDVSLERLDMNRITIYVEHPKPLEPPAEPAPPQPQPLKLTKKEQKKLRTQRRLAKEKDRQEMIRQGLLEPPKPKVKMSNLMKILDAEATQDPTRMEMEIRTAAAEREQAHVDRNIARKLTPSERRDKQERKLFDDPSARDCIVCVYIIREMSHPQTRFKVDVNARENRLTGAAVITDGISVVVVEGEKKPIKRYSKLMLNRVDWTAAVGVDADDADEEPGRQVNSCALVWQGSVAKRTFSRFSVHQCRSEAAAKKVFADASVPHYWDLAVNFSED